MKTFDEILSQISQVLTSEQLQLLKDTIRYGSWGDCEMGFHNSDGVWVSVYCYGYCTNDAKNAGHFSGRKCSAMFRSIYQRLGMLGKGSGANEYFAYCNDWWGDGSGDMFFIRENRDDNTVSKFEKWACE